MPSGEGLFVGLVALAAVPWLALRLRRGFGEGWLPIGKGRVVRAERPAAFRTLLLVYMAAGAMMAFISLDLLVGIS